MHKYFHANGDPVNKLDWLALTTEVDQISALEVNAVLEGIAAAMLALERARQAALAIRIVVATVVAFAQFFADVVYVRTLRAYSSNLHL